MPTKAELMEQVKELSNAVKMYHRAYDNIIIIQSSISKAIREIKREQRKAKKNGTTEDLARLKGHLDCLYKMSK